VIFDDQDFQLSILRDILHLMSVSMSGTERQG
jgi:hypothetical protein